MGKRSAIRSKHAPYFYIIFAAVTFFVGVFVTIVYQNVFAQGEEIIYACVHKNSGDLRIVTANETCKQNENSLNWNKEAQNNLPFTCNSCILHPVAYKFKGKDLSYAQLTRTDFQGADLTGTIFKGANMFSVDFSNSNLTNADFTDAGNYPGRSMSVTFTNANLTNANFTNANIRFSAGMNSANITGVIWNNTTCPNGTNSNNNGGTCAGHF
jgi:hypothetical protein